MSGGGPSARPIELNGAPAPNIIFNFLLLLVYLKVPSEVSKRPPHMRNSVARPAAPLQAHFPPNRNRHEKSEEASTYAL